MCICCTVHSHDRPHAYIATPSTLATAVGVTGGNGDTDDDHANYIADDDMTSTLRRQQQQQQLQQDHSSVALTSATAHSALAVGSPPHGRSQLDLQYKPTSQVLGMALMLFLFLFTWAFAALSVARPFELHLQDVLFNCFYWIFSSALGVFMLCFFVLCRSDVRKSWYYVCCTKKVDFDVDDVKSRTASSLRTLTPVMMTSYANGHAGHSSSSVTNGYANNHQQSSFSAVTPLNANHSYLYRPAANQSTYSSLRSSVPPTAATESSFTAVSQQQPQYPNFINPRQNGVARKYWRKKRMKNNLIKANRELYQRNLDYDSDVTNPMLQQQQQQQRDAELHLTPQSYLNQYSPPPSERSGKLGPPMSRAEQYELSPMVGLSSPPSVLQTDGANSCVTDSGVLPYDSRKSDVTVLPPPPPSTSPNISSQSLARPPNVQQTINANQYLLRQNQAPAVAPTSRINSASNDVCTPQTSNDVTGGRRGLYQQPIAEDVTRPRDFCHPGYLVREPGSSDPSRLSVETPLLSGQQDVSADQITQLPDVRTSSAVSGQNETSFMNRNSNNNSSNLCENAHNFSEFADSEVDSLLNKFTGITIGSQRHMTSSEMYRPQLSSVLADERRKLTSQSSDESVPSE